MRTPFDLTGRVALVTGAGSATGIGHATAVNAGLVSVGEAPDEEPSPEDATSRGSPSLAMCTS